MNNNATIVSCIIPCYRSENTISAVVDEIRSTFLNRSEYQCEIILIDDCSPDGVYRVIEALAKEDQNIHGISLAKNFGQHNALMAGMRTCKGDIIVCLDDDGQTPANEIFNLIDALDESTDVVYASYLHGQKKHSFFRNLGSRANDWMLRVLLSKPRSIEITSFFAAKRYVINEACQCDNPFPYAIGLVLRSTNKIKNVDVVHRSRNSGQSGYTFKKLVGLWLNGFTAFSVVPLRIATAMGFVFSVLGFAYAIFIVIKKLVVPSVPVGYSSMMAVMIVIGGVLMLLLGMLGEYVGRIYMSINRNPQYVIRKKTDEE
jgi:undecaprenyl-phosphate 4-deoxy-4-formamido-L-arabinose transferase